MAKIMQLSEHVANMIAAGEVVESPVSVVKELVENAIDANAKVIEINLLEAGIKKVEIVDNGVGMDENDALMAFNRHATSKIRNAYDLASIDTLGFRGEALPSIASVSTLELYTKEKEKEAGFKVTVKAGKLVEKISSPCNNGTRIVVSNLFYNTPARLKYLKSPHIILAKICELVDKLALANQDIKFKLTNNDQVLLNTNGLKDIYSLFGNIYGADVARNLKTNSGNYDGIYLKAAFTKPTLTRSRKNDITIIVNGRYVRNYNLTNAVVDAYKNYVPPLRYPICLLDIAIDPLLIDVNVHPQKMEVTFSTEGEVIELIKKVIIDGLKEMEVIPSISPIEVNPLIKQETIDPYINPVKEENHHLLEDSFKSFGGGYSEEFSSRNDYNLDLNYNSMEELKKEEDLKEVISKDKATTYQDLKPKKLPYLEYVGQALGTYLIFQNEEGIYLVDQHAAQERINYEKFYQKLSNPENASTPLLIPFNLEFKKEEAILLQNNLDKLKAFGLVLEPSGVSSFFVREIPLWIKNQNPEGMIEKILYFLLEKNCFEIGRLRDPMAKMMACKASIKANHYVDKQGAESLIKELETCENPFNCPHGRPVFVKLTNYEIEKLFKRVI